MQESRDPAIKLFGKKIPLQGEDEDPTISGDDSVSTAAIDVEKGGEGEEEEDDDEAGEKRPEEEEEEADKEFLSGKVTESPKEKEAEHLPEPSLNPKSPSIDEQTAKSSVNDDESNSQEKVLKKPEKVLPCPRCKSMDTKFCYYNNYNINQPRYFCKSCQRYWTAGGTFRNIPVGAGRRKNKNTFSHCRHFAISEALQAARIDAPNGTNGRVLSFGIDAPICDSMASVLNLAENNVASKSAPNGFRNHSFEDQKSTFSMEESGKNALQIPCLPPVVWPYPPGFSPLSFCHPAGFWNYGVSGNWNVPWFSSNSSLPTSKSPSSGPNSATLGKHTRDGDMLEPEYLQKEEPSKQRNGSVLVPKTLRIDDPSEAAKSSIWTTLGIKNELVSGGGMFEAFQSKKDEKNQKHHGVETFSVLRANPAALSRSLNFHENT